MRFTPCLPLVAAGLSTLSLAQVTVDGTVDITSEPYLRLATQTVETQYGDNQNELNGLYGVIDGGKLHLVLTGNLQASAFNPNQLHVFIDSKVGGEGTLSGSPGAAGTGGMDGCVFDSGIAADFHLVLRRQTGNFQVDFAELGGGVDYYGNIFSGADTGSTTTGTGSINATGIQVAYDDSNVFGVGGSASTAANQAQARAVTTGVELGIDLADLDHSGGPIYVTAMISNHQASNFSNQFLGGLPNPQGNFSGDWNLSASAGEQYGAVAGAAPRVNGLVSGDEYPVLSTQTVETQYGDNLNELNAAHGVIRGGRLYLGFTGNLQVSGSNQNQLHVFIDSKDGGESTLSGVPGAAGTSGMAGLVFDSGMAPDFHLIARRGTNYFMVDFAELGGNVDFYGDVFGGSDVGSGSTGAGSVNLSGIDVAYNNSNSAGVGGAASTAADADAARAVVSGFEVSVDLTDLGYVDGPIKVTAFISNGGASNYSNQWLGGLPNPYGNFSGNPDLSAISGAQYFSVWPERFSGAKSVATLDNPYFVHVADLDGDGDGDLLSGHFAGGDLLWYENTDGAGTYSAASTLAVGAGPNDARAADLDGDGDLDVVTSNLATDRLAWIENLGSGSFGAVQDVAGTTYPLRLDVADLDGDGDLDLVGNGFSSLTWAENQGSGVFVAQPAVATYAGSEDGMHVTAADLDGDGDLDLLATSDDSVPTAVVWYENTDGAGTFGAAQSIATGDRPWTTCAADLDGDGDLDVASILRDGAELFWNENTDGLGTFGSNKSIHGPFEEGWWVQAADVDSDGDMDLVASDVEETTVAWFPNDGGGRFAGRVVIRRSLAAALSGDLGDVDGDGDLDLAIGSDTDQAVLWYENQYARIYSQVTCTVTNNSGGSPATLSARGTDAVSSNDLTLRVSGLPTTGTTAYLFNAFLSPGQTLSTVSTPSIAGVAASGDVCIAGGTFGRHVFGGDIYMGTDGFFDVSLDLSDIPSPRDAGVNGNPSYLYSTSILAGETWYWQCWYRDPSSGTGHSNFSEAISITFR